MLSGKFSLRAVFCFLILMGLTGFGVAAGHAQSTFGTIRGTTLDQSGSSIPQAQVSLHSVDENSDFTAISDDHGNFMLVNVKPGHYNLAATKEGFAKAIVERVELAARQDLRLDVKLALSSHS